MMSSRKGLYGLWVVVLAFTLVITSACGVSQEEHNATLLQLAEARSKLQTTLDEVDAVSRLNEQLSADLETTKQQLTEKAAENDTLAADLETATQQLADKTAESETLAAEYETLLGEVGQLEAVRDQKDDLLTDIDTLESRIGELQTEIASLQAQRAPLILETYTTGFACTGSMEPKITCLDSATWLANFRPQDIVVGAVVSFTPTVECNLSASRVAHRVMAIKIESGIYYYWPKGDANSQDDGCWIPHGNVDAYLIELHKNTHPENQPLRDKVNSAKYAFEQADINYKSKKETYDQKRDYYDQKYLEYCGSMASGCTLPSHQYNEMKQLYDELLALEAELDSLLAIRNNAYNTYKQAQDEAMR